MPLYFAYGSNMNALGFRARCPRSASLGLAELPGHRFTLMRSSGYASVVPEPAASVHGVLIDLDASDVAALDEYEDVAGGLYTRAAREVHCPDGSARFAAVYLGAEREDGGTPPPGYMECVVAGARDAGLPPGYVAALAALLPPGGPGEAAW